MSRVGVTGAETKAGMLRDGPINTLREFNALPCAWALASANRPRYVKPSRPVPLALISGSAVVKIIETHHKNPEHMLTRLKEFCGRDESGDQ